MGRRLKQAFAFIVLMALFWALVVYSELTGLTRLDFGFTRLLNSSVGLSPSLDLTLIFLSDTPGDVFGIILASLLIIHMLKRDKRGAATLANHAALAVYIGIVVLSTYLMVDALDSTFERRSPARQLADFKLPGATINFEFETSSDSRFPSERGAIYTALFFLCFFRFGTKALVLALFPILFGVLRVVVGRAWPTDVLGGYLLGWVVATTVYLINGNRAYHYLDLWLESVYITRLRGRFLSYLSRKARKLRDFQTGRSGRPKDGAGLELSEDIALLLREEWAVKDTRLLAPPHKGKVFPLEIDDTPLAFKISRLANEDRDQLDNALNAADRLTRQGLIPCPAIIPTRKGRMAVPYAGRMAYLMEWIDGTPCDLNDPGHRRHLFQLLARFHAENELCNDDGEFRIGKVVESEVERTAQALRVGRDDLMRLYSGLVPDNSEFSSMGGLIEEACWAESIARLSLVHFREGEGQMRPCLIHGDTHPMNYLVDAQGSMYILDFDYIRPGLAFEDLAGPMGRIMRMHQWSAAVFEEALAAYRGVRPLDDWEVMLVLGRVLLPQPLIRWRKHRKKFGIFRRKRDRLRLLKDVVQHTLLRPRREEFVRATAHRLHLPELTMILGAEPKSGMGHPEGSGLELTVGEENGETERD